MSPGESYCRSQSLSSPAASKQATVRQQSISVVQTSTNYCKSDKATALYRSADKSLARPGKKQPRKHVRRRTRFQQHRVAKCHQVFSSLQGKTPKEIHAILTEILVCSLPGRGKDLSAPLVTST